jgi:hypothetical protein
VKDEAIVKKWIEDQSFKIEYNCLNVAEALKLPNREELEKHFRQVHMANIIKAVEAHTLNGAAARQMRSPDLQRLMRVTWEEQRRFPLKVATTLSQQFAGCGLQFFKVNRTVTHVSVARPHYLDLEATPVSEGVKRIVEFINTNPRATRRKLLETLAPGPAPAPVAPTAPTDATAPPPAPAPIAEASPEQAALAGDLHWLIHQGHVIEFANGVLETAKRPAPKPPKPAKKPEEPASGGGTAAPTNGESASAAPVESAAVAPEEEEAVAASADEQRPASVPGGDS